MKFVIALGSLLWLMVTVYGVVYLKNYELQPGEQPSIYPIAQPADDAIPKSDSRAQLLFFSHPKCPCTKASLRELSRLMADTNGRMAITIIFAVPEGLDRSFADTDLKAFAEQLPGAKVIVDDNEAITRKYGAETSGFVVLYDSEGKLRFHGGITSSRGHEGDSAGKDAIYKIVMEKPNYLDNAPVYGCPLHKKDCPGEQMEPAQN
jgi:hypothetical protein